MRAGLLFVLVACGGSSSRPDPDARSLDAPADVVSTGRHGLVTLSTGTSNGTADGNVSAVFVDGSALGPVLGIDGPCTSYQAPPDRGLSAGTITITGTTTDLTMTPMGTSPLVMYTATPPTPSNLFATGATIDVQGTGADVPAFSATVTAPATLVGFTPPVAMSRAGFDVTWTAATAQLMWLILVNVNFGNNHDAILCRIPDSGSYEIAASTFALVPGGVTRVAIGLARISETDVVAGSASVAVAAASTITAGSVPLTP